MKVRALDENHDWSMGHKLKSEAIAQNVKTQILSLFNDWFLDFENGIKWFDYLTKNTNLNKMRDEIKKQILKADGVVSLETLNINLVERKAIIQVQYSDIYNENLKVLINASE